MTSIMTYSWPLIRPNDFSLMSLTKQFMPLKKNDWAVHWRITNNKEFLDLRKITRPFKTSTAFFYYFLDNDFAQFKVGIKTKKDVGNAVYRNKIKRSIREFMRTSCLKTTNYKIVIVVRKNHLKLPLNDFKSCLKNDLKLLENYLLHQ